MTTTRQYIEGASDLATIGKLIGRVQKALRHPKRGWDRVRLGVILKFLLTARDTAKNVARG